MAIPRITGVDLKGFSLYALAKHIEFEISPGATCLAGANGLGKSTFIAAVNFGLTGCIPNPGGQQSRNLSEYRRDAIAFSREYFSGRIAEKDRDRASVALELELGRNRIFIERPLFRSDPELTKFRVSFAAAHGRGRPIIENSRTTKGSTRLGAYESFLTAQVGLDDFDQFVFLQHYVLTFDEHRHLLFWDSRATEQALFLIFGGNREAADADRLRRAAERADSRARNLQFNATRLEQRISDLQSAFGLSSNDRVDEGLVASVERLFSEQTDAEKRLEKCESALSEAILQVADSAASLVSLRDEYTRRFQDLLAGHADPAGNPIVKSSLQDAVCGVCGTASEAVVAEIQRRLDRGRCPLCNSEVRQSDSVTSFAELLAIDKRIQEAQEGYNLACRTKSRAEEERNSASQALISATRQIKQLEQSERDLIARIRDKHLRVGEDPDQISLRALRTDLAGLLATKVVALKERDAKRAELATLQRLLSTRYTSAEELFLPIFRNLAELFLGRPVNIRLRKVSAGLSLLIDVDNAERREAYQLSESQRFFVDVALRMALAQFMSPSGTLAPLYVDTPEGALDIAYEKQAGAMFARFVRSGHNLLMTANVNSSQLLLELAKECRRKLFHLVVMTTWSRLSTVQLEGQALFESSIRAIRSAMNAR